MDLPPHTPYLPAASDADSPFQSESALDDPANASGAIVDLQAVPKSTHDIRELYLSRSEITPSAGVSVPDASGLPTMASRVWARAQSRFPLDRRVVVGLALFGVACALLIGLSRSDFAPSIKTASGTTYNTAVERLASAVSAGLDLIGKPPVGPVTTKDVASISSTKVPNVRPTPGKRGPINSSRALELTPFISAEAIHANVSAPIGNVDVNAALETESKEALALPPDDSVVEAPIVYSPNDTDVSSPVAIRSPGIATDLDLGNPNVTLIEILVTETGRVESAKVRRRPATLGAALQSAAAVSVVKTWRFWPARKNGQPVKFRTTVPVETVYPAGMTDGIR
jgi:TonB family protein